MFLPRLRDTAIQCLVTVSVDLTSCCGYRLGHRSISGPPVLQIRFAVDSETAMELRVVSRCGLSCLIVPRTTADAMSSSSLSDSISRKLRDWSQDRLLSNCMACRTQQRSMRLTQRVDSNLTQKALDFCIFPKKSILVAAIAQSYGTIQMRPKSQLVGLSQGRSSRQRSKDC